MLVDAEPECRRGELVAISRLSGTKITAWSWSYKTAELIIIAMAIAPDLNMKLSGGWTRRLVVSNRIVDASGSFYWVAGGKPRSHCQE